MDILGEGAQHKILLGRRTVGTAVALGVEQWRHLLYVFAVGAAVDRSAGAQLLGSVHKEGGENRWGGKTIPAFLPEL